MSPTKKDKQNHQDYETLLKDYQQAQAQLTRTQVREKAAKKSLKAAEKKDASKTEIELLRLELAIAKAKRKGRKAGVAIAKIHLKQWVKANAKSEKSYKLTIEEDEEVEVVAKPVKAAKPVEEVKTKRPYTRREKTETAPAPRAVLADEVPEGKAGISASKKAEPQSVMPEAEKKERRPRRSSAEVAAEKEAARAALRELGDDFSIIEGIGPALRTLLHEENIKSFAQLAASDATALKAVLKSRGNKIADPTTWPEQAKLVVDNDWESLKKLQDALKKPRS